MNLRVPIAERVNPRQQLVQKNTEREDISQRRGGSSAHLLRAGVIRSHRPGGGLGGQRRVLVPWKEFGYSEIHELRPAVRRHKNIAGFQVAVDDQILVQIDDGGTDLAEKFDDAVYRKPLLLAVSVDRLPID